MNTIPAQSFWKIKLNFYKQYCIQATRWIAALTVLTAVVSSITIVSLVYYYEGNVSQDSISRFLGSRNIYAQSGDQVESAPPISPFQSRFYNNTSPYSIFGTCFEETLSEGEYTIYFGYRNNTKETIELQQSTIPGGNKIETISNDYSIDTKKKKDHATLPYSTETQGYNPFFLKVTTNSTGDIIWKTKYHNKITQEKTGRTARVNIKYLLACSRDSSNNLIDTFHEGFSVPRISSKDGVLTSVADLDPFKKVNIFVMCSEFTFDNQGQKMGSYDAIFGYRNESGDRINLTTSKVTGSNEGARDIVHLHFQLKGENLENMGLLANQEYKDSEDPKLQEKYQNAKEDNDLLIPSPEKMSELTTPIQYLRSGQESYAMIVTGYGQTNNRGDGASGYEGGQAEDLIWSISREVVDDTGNTYLFDREVRANPLFDEPCQDDALNQVFDINGQQTSRYSELNQLNPSKKVDQANTVNPNNSQSVITIPSTSPDLSQTPPLQEPGVTPATNPVNERAILNPPTNSQTDPKKNNQPTENQSKNGKIVFNSLFGSIKGLAQDTSPAESQVLGGIDLNTYCKSQFGKDAVAQFTGGDIYSWKCGDVAINMTSACRWEYSEHPEAYAVVKYLSDGTQSTSPYDWICGVDSASYSAVLGGVNLSGYCQSKYGSQADATLKGSTPYDWVCQNSNISIDFNAACKFQYGLDSSAFSDNPNDPYSLVCVRGDGNVISSGGGGTGGGEVNQPPFEDNEPEIGFGDIAQDYFANNDADVFIDRNGEFFLGIINQISDSIYYDLKQEVFNPLQESANCKFYDVACKSKSFQALWNMARIVISYQLGVLKGLGQALFDIGKMIWDLITNFKDIIMGLFTSIQQLIQNPSMFIDMIIGELITFAGLDIYGKAEYIGKFVGQLIPDIILAIVTAGGSVTANIGSKIAQTLDKVSDAVRAATRVLNVAEVLIGKTLMVATNVTINIVKVGTRIVMKGLELWDKIQSLPLESFQKLISLLSGSVKEVAERVFVVVKSCIASTASTSSLMVFALSGVSVQAASICPDVPPSVLRGSQNPIVASAARRGREMHNIAKLDPISVYGKEAVDAAKGDFMVEEPIAGRKYRVDAIDMRNKIVYELKPNTPTGKRKGEKQLRNYKAALEAEHNETFTTVLIFYDP